MFNFIRIDNKDMTSKENDELLLKENKNLQNELKMSLKYSEELSLRVTELEERVKKQDQMVKKLFKLFSLIKKTI